MNASDAVDLYSGEAQLTLDLVHLAGRNGLDLRVSLVYSSRIYDAATTWNLTEPTGVLGLGWSLPFYGIAATYGANVSDVSYFLIAGGDSGPLACVGVNADGTRRYQGENFRFWQITYDPSRQRWTIVHEDGNTWILGDINSGRGTVQWSVRWDNWRGASAEQDGQSPAPVVFNLSEIGNRFGDRITWEYQTVPQIVGPARSGEAPAYTQGCYLKRLTGVNGETVVFTYADKTVDATIQEFVVPHTPGPPNAYQDRYLTRYLASLTAFSSDGTPCFTQQFLYTDASNQPAFLGTGAFAKRLLTGVRQIPAGVSTWLPEPRFAYGGQDAEDAVSLTTPFNAGTRRLYGALKHLTMPEGGIIAYDYAAIAPTLSSRTVNIQPPVQTGVTLSAPRFHFAPDFVVCTWLGSDSAMRVRTSWWDGRWIAPGQQTAALDSLPVASAADYDQAPVVCDTSLFGAFSQNQVHLYRADNARAGMWIQPSVTQGSTTVNYFTTAFATDEPVRFVTGDRFAAVLGRSGGTLCRYRFTGAAWTADPAVSLVPGPGPVLYDAAARDNYICAIAAPQTGGSPLRLSLFVCGETGDWQTSTFTVDRELSAASALTVTPGDTFAIVILTATALPQIQTEYIACWWSADGTRLSSHSLGVFTTTGAALTPSVRGASVAIGETLFRFDGVTWSSQNISANPLQAIAYGDDLVLRTLQGPGALFTYTLTQYLPDNGTWASAVSPTAGVATNINAAAQGRATISPFAIVDSTLYHRAPDATWVATSLTLPALTGNDALSVVLAEARFLVYQQSGNTVVVPLKNGASLAAVTLTGQQVYTPETSLVGTHAYVTYTGTFGASGSTLALSRVVEDAAAGAIECYVVATRTASNGYQSTPTAYVYNAATAIADAARVLRSNQTTSVVGGDVLVRPSGWIDRYAFNGLCPDETPALPYPVDPSFTNAPDFYTFVAGLVYDLRTYPTEAEPAGFESEDITETWVYPVTLGQVARGLYQRTLKMAGSVDGVATETTSTFNAATGLVTQLTSNNYNSLGQAEQSVTLYKYFWEVYDTSRQLNLLTPLAQTTMQTVANATTTVTGMFVTTFRDDWGSGTGRWAPDRTYRALSDTASAFTSWNRDQPDPAGWLRTSTTLDVNTFGLPRRMATVDGLVAASLYDTSNLMAVATFMNADPDGDEATYYGFDPYEEPDGWSWSGSGTLSSHITMDQWHTGVQCLGLAGTAGRKDGPVRRLFPAGQSRVYVFGVWVKTTPGFNPAAGQAAFTVDVYAVATNQLVTTLSLAISDTKNAWAYLQQTIDLPSIRTAARLPPETPLYLWVSGWNQNTAATVFADNLRFSPIDATMSVTVYDPVKRLVTATLDTNGQTTRIVYDEYDRTVVTLGAGECVTGVSAESYSRDVTAARTFLPTFPNMRLSLATSSESAYYDFHDALKSDWALTEAGGAWNFTGGQLVFTGTSTDSLGSTAAPTKFAFTNFGARVTCTAHTGTAGLGNGDAFVLWDPDASAWRLVRRQTSGAPVRIAINSDVGFRPDWVYVIVDGLLLFFAGGVIVFAYAYQDPNVTLPNYGQPSLMLTKDGAFDDLVVLNNPQLTLSFCDGTGQKLQSVTLLGYAGGTTYATTSEGTFFDTLGRPHIARKTAGPPLALAAPPSITAARTGELVKGGETTYLVNSAGQSVSLVDYLMGRYGFDYTRYDFEPSPLSRVAAMVLPREQAQPEDKFTVKYEYGPATAEIIANVLPAGIEQHYLMRTTTDQDGVVRYDLLDQTGKIIAIRVRTGSTTFVTAAAIYDASGALVTVKQPNAFDPPANSDPSAWLETRTYTFNGLLASRTAPDEGSSSIPGTTSYLYDKADRLRFSSTPDGAALTPPLFIYMKYDALGRCIEEGDIQAVGVTWATLASKVDDPTYPDLTTVAGRWTKRRTYDVAANGDAMNLLGRLWRVSVNNGTQDSTADTETHAYDVRGNVIGVVTSAPSVNAAPYTSAFAWDNQDRVTVITYPFLPGETPFQTAYCSIARGVRRRSASPWIRSRSSIRRTRRRGTKTSTRRTPTTARAR